MVKPNGHLVIRVSLRIKLMVPAWRNTKIDVLPFINTTDIVTSATARKIHKPKTLKMQDNDTEVITVLNEALDVD